MIRDIGPRTRRFLRELKAYCKEVGVTPSRSRALAKFLKVSEVTVYNWWGGKRYPTTEQLLGVIEWRAKVAKKENPEKKQEL